MTVSEAREELLGVTRAWDEAMVRNDAEAIGAFMADGGAW